MKKRFKSIGAVALSLAMVASIIPASAGKADAAADYSYDDRYSLGWVNGGIAVFQGGTESTPIAEADIPIYDGPDENPFDSELDQAWDEPALTLQDLHSIQQLMEKFMISKVCLPVLISLLTLLQLIIRQMTESFTCTELQKPLSIMVIL